MRIWKPTFLIFVWWINPIHHQFERVTLIIPTWSISFINAPCLASFGVVLVKREYIFCLLLLLPKRSSLVDLTGDLRWLCNEGWNTRSVLFVRFDLQSKSVSNPSGQVIVGKGAGATGAAGADAPVALVVRGQQQRLTPWAVVEPWGGMWVPFPLLF